jgi:hypothetical protein
VTRNLPNERSSQILGSTLRDNSVKILSEVVDKLDEMQLPVS